MSMIFLSQCAVLSCMIMYAFEEMFGPFYQLVGQKEAKPLMA